MSRPVKARRICAYPQPLSRRGGAVLLTMDEYEVIRLLDYEGMTHEQAANQMQVARATVTNIYESARKKVAKSIIERRRLDLSGGNVYLCPDANEYCCGACGFDRCDQCDRPCLRNKNYYPDK